MSIPYGLRDVKITPYTDAAGKVLSTERIDLPVAQTFSFSEVEEFQQLRGDDRVAAEHGSGPSVEWSLGHGGISYEALRAMNGGTIITESGKKTYRKSVDNVRPYFLVEGQSINDDGGDTHLVVYRCKASGNLEGEFADGAFFVTSASGSGTGVPEDAPANANRLWDFVTNDTTTAIPSGSQGRIDRIVPAEGVAASEQFLVQGAGFSGGFFLDVGDDPATTETLDDNNIVVTMPAGTAGAVVITVSWNSGAPSSVIPYTRTA